MNLLAHNRMVCFIALLATMIFSLPLAPSALFAADATEVEEEVVIVEETPSAGEAEAAAAEEVPTGGEAPEAGKEGFWQGPWPWIIGGGVVAGGAAAVIIATQDDDGGGNGDGPGPGPQPTPQPPQPTPIPEPVEKTYTRYPNSRIPPSGTSGTTYDYIDIPDSGTVDYMLTLGYKIYHQCLCDLVVTLRDPGGKEVTFVNHDFPCMGGTVEGSRARSDFKGRNIQGSWRLKISDTYSDYYGNLDNWYLKIKYTPN